MPDFNASRMDLARRRRGLTKRALAEALAVSPRMITAYERGDKEPSDETRGRLAEVLDFPEAFFFGPDPEAVESEASSFRAATRLTAQQRHQALASGALALTLSDWIEARFKLPLTAIPQYQGVDPETAAEAVRADWGLGEQRISNMAPPAGSTRSARVLPHSGNAGRWMRSRSGAASAPMPLRTPPNRLSADAWISRTNLDTSSYTGVAVLRDERQSARPISSGQPFSCQQEA